MGRIASNSHSNRILNVVMPELTFFWQWLLALQPYCQGILNRGWKCEVGDLKMRIWKYWYEYLKVVEWRKIPRKSLFLPYFPPQEVPLKCWYDGYPSRYCPFKGEQVYGYHPFYSIYVHAFSVQVQQPLTHSCKSF